MITYISGGNAMSQNIYDNELFFKGYKELRDRDVVMDKIAVIGCGGAGKSTL